MSIAYAVRLGLGPTNPEMINIAQETLLLRPTGFSPVLWLLIPAFSLVSAPRVLSSLASPLNTTLLYHYVLLRNPCLRYYTLAPLHFPRKIS